MPVAMACGRRQRRNGPMARWRSQRRYPPPSSEVPWVCLFVFCHTPMALSDTLVFCSCDSPCFCSCDFCSCDSSHFCLGDSPFALAPQRGGGVHAGTRGGPQRGNTCIATYGHGMTIRYTTQHPAIYKACPPPLSAIPKKRRGLLPLLRLYKEHLPQLRHSP